ncbi:MAG TPA: hypothetical protein O0X39_01260 [Methanocorpusculum sp.]|nr:hypothetical protein [Methanocorpusculum sp.]
MPERRTNKNPSLSSRRNLWRSKTEEAKYSREARAFIADYGARLQEALKIYSREDADGNVTIDMAGFQERMEQIKTVLLAQTGATITKEHAKAGLTLGIEYAERSLKDAGVEDAKSAV